MNPASIYLLAELGSAIGVIAFAAAVILLVRGGTREN